MLAPVVHGEDVWVVQSRGGLRLRPEAAQEGLVVGERRVQHLDRNPPAETDVVGQVDLGRAARADGGDQAVPPAEDTTDLVCHAGHGHGERVTAHPARSVHPVWVRRSGLTPD